MPSPRSGDGPSPTRPATATLPRIASYMRHLDGTTRWLLRSIERGRGGSAAFFSPVGGWSRPYPETTGYIIPTLLELEQRLPQLRTRDAALAVGEWLLDIQREDGAWNSGLHPPRHPRPSVFNTGQVLKGLLALHQRTGDAQWLSAAARGGAWLVAGLEADGLWGTRDYQSEVTPSYYSEVLWPMLELAQHTGDAALRAATVRALDAVVSRRQENGVIAGWAFREGAPAFTHTIAYTLWGIIQCAERLGEQERYFAHVVPALEVLVRRSELAGGALPGAFDARWKAAGRFVCLTGNAQVAQCVLAWEAHAPDLRLVSAAARMVDYVCDRQRLTAVLPGVRGAVAGSDPVWGRYMRLRYPNWAAKYHCDALMMLIDRVEREG